MKSLTCMFALLLLGCDPSCEELELDIAGHEAILKEMQDSGTLRIGLNYRVDYVETLAREKHEYAQRCSDKEPR